MFAFRRTVVVHHELIIVPSPLLETFDNHQWFDKTFVVFV